MSRQDMRYHTCAAQKEEITNLGGLVAGGKVK